MPNLNARRAGLALALVASLLFLGSCKPDRTPFLTVASQSAAVAPSGTTTVTATCKPTAKRIGGGFLVSPDNDNRGLAVRGSFPSDANGWTVQVDNTAPAKSDTSTVLAVAYCLERADLSPTVTVVPAGAAVTLGISQPKSVLRATCPSGSVLTGGGYLVDGPPLDITDANYNAGVQESSPEPSEWYLEVGEWFHQGQRLYKAFAVCTSAPLSVGTVATAAYGGGQPGSRVTFEATCPDATFSSAGGFRLKGSAHGQLGGETTQHPARAYESAGTAQFKQWTAMVIP